jgi:hypothetical protein
MGPRSGGQDALPAAIPPWLNPPSRGWANRHPGQMPPRNRQRKAGSRASLRALKGRRTLFSGRAPRMNDPFPSAIYSACELETESGGRPSSSRWTPPASSIRASPLVRKDCKTLPSIKPRVQQAARFPSSACSVTAGACFQATLHGAPRWSRPASTSWMCTSIWRRKEGWAEKPSLS